MSAYKNALAIDDSSSEQSISLAVELLELGDEVVLYNDVLALRLEAGNILCEIIDPYPTSHRCAEEFKVLIENAQRTLADSKIGHRLQHKQFRWLVVEDNGTGTIELWPEP